MLQFLRFLRNNLGRKFPLFSPFIRSAYRLESALLRCLELVSRTLAPLRRITSRKLFAYVVRIRPRHALCCLRDTLECGHIIECGIDSLRDLMNAYTENSVVRARRHRCHECAALVAERKPVQSVAAIAAKAGAA